MVLETARLVLRPWKEEDADTLYEYAKSPFIGPPSGWSAHTSRENSVQVIREILSAEETYAVTLKGDGAAIGSIGLLIGNKSDLGIPENEAEVGYWIGKPFWGQGYIPEAAHELMRHAFDDLDMATLWIGFFEENAKSQRVSEKCGFTLHHTEKDKEVPLLGERRTEQVTRLTKQEWQRQNP